MDMRKLPGDPAAAMVFDWDLMLGAAGLGMGGLGPGGGEEALPEILVHETRIQQQEPAAWWKAPRVGHWRFPPA